MATDTNSVSFRRLGKDLKASFGEWKKDNAPQFAAAIAFYTILSLAPLLVFAITIAGIVFEAEAASGEIVTNVEQYVGRGAAEMVQEVIANASTRGGGLLASLLGFAVLAFGASRIFKQLKIALNQILDVPTPEEGGITKMLWDRLVAIIAVAGVGIFLMASILVGAILNRVGDALPIPGGSIVWQTVSSSVTLALIATVFALIFRYLPDTDIPWRHVWEGAIFTAIMFLVGQIVISIYLSKSDPGGSFGAAGPVIVILVWIYFTTVIVFFGAEFMEVRSRRHPAVAERRRLSSSGGEQEGADVESQPGAIPSHPPLVAKSEPSKGGSGVKMAGSAALGGCLGMVIGIGSAMLGLLIGSVKLTGKFLGRR